MLEQTFKNLNCGDAVVLRGPEGIMDEIAALDIECEEVLAKIRGCYEEKTGTQWES